MSQILPQKNSFSKTQAFFYKTKYFFSKNKIQKNIPRIYASWAKTKKDIKELQNKLEPDINVLLQQPDWRPPPGQFDRAKQLGPEYHQHSFLSSLRSIV